MIEEHAVVTEVQGNRAGLQLERRTACGLCGQKKGCGNATWGKLLGHHQHTFYADNPIQAAVGSHVIVGIDTHAVLGTVFYLYVVPLLSMLGATVAADVIFKNQFYVMLAAALGVLIGFFGVKAYLAKTLLKRQYQAVILRHADDSEYAAGAGCARASAPDPAMQQVVNFETKRGE